MASTRVTTIRYVGESSFLYDVEYSQHACLLFPAFSLQMGHFERPPLDKSTLRSVYHVRNVDVYRMKCLSRNRQRLDIMISHDWPLGIEQHGDTQQLLRKKPFFRAEVEQNCLGSPPNREILDTVQPKCWFSAHLHVKFKALLRHTSEPISTPTDSSILLVPSQVTTKTVERETGGEDEAKSDHKDDATDSKNVDPEERETKFHGLESSSRCAGADLTEQMTQFLALDKCLPRRQYLSILHIPSEVPREEARLEYDSEWLAIVAKTHQLICTERRKVKVSRESIEISDSEIAEIENRLKDKNDGDLAIPDNFCQTVPLYFDPLFDRNCPPFQEMGNPQTDTLLGVLGLDHVLTVPFDPEVTPFAFLSTKNRNDNLVAPDANEIDIDDLSDGNGNEKQDVAVPDANEIDIDEISDQSEHKKQNVVICNESRDQSTRPMEVIQNEDENEIEIESLDADVIKTYDKIDVEDEAKLPVKKARLDE